MTLVVPRMAGAVAGFLAKYHVWPTMLLVPADNWERYTADRSPVETSYDGPASRAIFSRIKLLPVPLPKYIALDDHGRWCDYDGAEQPAHLWEYIAARIEPVDEAMARSAGANERPPFVCPIPNSYLLPNTLFVAGEYPGSTPRTTPDAAARRLEAFLDAGVAAFIDLTEPADRLAPYAELLKEIAAQRGVDVTHEKHTIRDMDVCHPDHMTRVLDAIDAHLEDGRRVYVHCWGGIGRTGTVVGCWLVRQGVSGDEALKTVGKLFRTMSPEKVRRHKTWGSPQTEPQRDMVRGWAAHESQSVRLSEAEQAAMDEEEANYDLVALAADMLAADEAAARAAPVANRQPTTATRDVDHEAVSTDTRGKSKPRHSIKRGSEALNSLTWELIAPRSDATPEIRDRMRGALLGLAVGDAVGTTVEFRAPGSFPPVTDMVGGGPFRLIAGQWTDDTSMALCLAESLIIRRTFDPRDQMERYVRWRRDGHLSSTGRCFDIGNTCSAALTAFERTGEPFSGPTSGSMAGNGSLMRLAPIPLFFFGRSDDVIAMAAESSRTTHGSPVAIDACRYLAALIDGALAGVNKRDLLSPSYARAPGYWDTQPLHPVIAEIAAGSFTKKSLTEIKGTGYAADALEAALWAFQNSTDFREGCLLAVNLGNDADTTAAIYGQLAGAFYGETGIPVAWRERLAERELLDRYAELLFQLSFDGHPVAEARMKMAHADAESLIADAGGDPAFALAQLIEEEQAAMREMGAFAFHMGGSVSGQAMRDETVLALRVAIGVRNAQHGRIT